MVEIYDAAVRLELTASGHEPDMLPITSRLGVVGLEPTMFAARTATRPLARSYYTVHYALARLRFGAALRRVNAGTATIVRLSAPCCHGPPTTIFAVA